MLRLTADQHFAATASAFAAGYVTLLLIGKFFEHHAA
jgi:hypothetical protein